MLTKIYPFSQRYTHSHNNIPILTKIYPSSQRYTHPHKDSAPSISVPQIAHISTIYMHLYSLDVFGCSQTPPLFSRIFAIYSHVHYLVAPMLSNQCTSTVWKHCHCSQGFSRTTPLFHITSNIHTHHNILLTPPLSI